MTLEQQTVSTQTSHTQRQTKANDKRHSCSHDIAE